GGAAEPVDGEGRGSDDRQDEEAQRCRGEEPPDAGGRHHVTRHDTTPRGMRYGTVGVNVTWPRERPRPVDVPLRAPAPPAQPRFWGRPRRGPSRPPPILLRGRGGRRRPEPDLDLEDQESRNPLS